LNNDFELKSLKDVGIFEDIPETADTIEGNAVLKARYVFKKPESLVLRMIPDWKLKPWEEGREFILPRMQEKMLPSK
jgi:hypothetical protein